MIIVSISGGLGNQMFQYSSAMALAYRCGHACYCDIGSFERLSTHSGLVLDRIFQGINLASKQDILNLKGSDSLFANMRRRLRWKKSFYSEWGHGSILPDFHVDMYLEGYFQNPLNWESRKFDIRSRISVAAPYESREKLESRIVGVHVRRGDFLQNDHLNIVTLDYYKKAFSFFEGDEVIFRVFSDDFNWVKENFSEFPNIQMVRTSIDELDDWYSLMACDDFIIPNSSFSWWAAYLGRAKEKKVIIPRNWTRELSSESWVPKFERESWIRI